MMKPFHLWCALVAGASMLTSCSESTLDAPTPSSFEQLQTKVLAKSCAVAGCHVAGSEMAAESGLVLEAAVAYENMIGVEPKNETARAHGLLRVKPGVPDSSFLFIKVHDPSHHSGYKAQMPLGADALSAGQIEFIRQWIAAGAPKTGVVADAALLADTSHHQVHFTPLPPPAPGEGYQISTGLFTVAPNFERELFIYRRLGNPSAIYVNRIETKMRSGSHHLVLYNFHGIPNNIKPAFDVIRDIRRPDNSMDNAAMQPMGYHQFVSGAMTPHESYQFPPGVAIKLPANFAIDMNSHYVNVTSETRTGEAFANFYTVDSSQVQKIAKPLFLNYDQFVLPPNQRTTIVATHRMPARRSIFLLSSHMHKRGEKFVIKISGGPRNGEVVYTSTDWEHPPVKIFNDNPIVLEAGEGLTSETTYYNETSRPIEFGLTSEDEMDIIYAYYY